MSASGSSSDICASLPSRAPEQRDAAAPAPGPISRRANGIAVAVLLQPKASDSRIVGVGRGADGVARLKVRVTAPPSEGAANAALIRLLAKTLGLAPSRLSLVQGAADRRKLVAAEGNAAMLEEKLKPWLEGRP